MKKRIISLVLAIAMLSTILPEICIETTAVSSGAGSKVIEGGKRDFKWPVPNNYGLSGCFIDNRNPPHHAIDIPAACGTPVVASYDGTVIQAFDSGEGYGKCVLIEHKEYSLLTNQKITLYSKYNHLNSYSVSAGTKVKAGDTIGTVGNSGGSYGYHLDFQIMTSSDWGNYNYHNISIDPFINELLELPDNIHAASTEYCCGVGPSGCCCYYYIQDIKDIYATPISTIYETAWFPAPQMYLTQIAYESYSHGSQNAVDIAPGGNVFAPFTGKVVYKDGNWGYVVLQSVDKVHYADGTLDYMTVAFMHDENIDDLYVGQIINQGVAFYQAGGMGNGNPNAYGDHVHLSVHKGQSSAITSAGKYGAGDVYAYDAFYVNTSKTTSVINQGVMASGNYMNNGAPSSWAGLWSGLENTRPGKPILTHTIQNSKVTFTWNETANTTHYNLWLETKNAAGEWEYVEQIFYAKSGVTREFEKGEYRAQLLSYNSNAYESDGSDWVHTLAEDVFFTIGKEKQITYYDAAGNVWLTENSENDVNYALAECYPTCTDGYFSGWAYSQNAQEWAIRPGETLEITDDISLYPVYVSHTDAISGEAVLIYNIADFTQTGYDIEEVEVSIQHTANSGHWTDWSDYTTSEISTSDTVQVETTTLYRYYYFYCPSCGGREPFWGTSDCGASIPESAWRIGWFTTPFSQCNYQTYSYTSAKYYTSSLGDNQIWNFSSGNLYDTAVGTRDNGVGDVVITTGYRSRTYVEQTENIEKTVVAYRITKKANKQYEVISFPSRTNYWVGEGLDLNGLVLKITYEDGSTVTATDGFDVSGFDTDTVGTKTVTITYGDFSVTYVITVSYGGPCGENVWWNLDNEGTLSIFGAGPMPKQYSGDAPWADYLSAIKKVEVQNGVTSISWYAFQNCTNMTNAILASSITSIGGGAFRNCTALTNIVIPDGITLIDNGTFDGCTALTSIYIPDDVTSIGATAFSNCVSLTNIDISNVTDISPSAFYQCAGLTAIDFSESISHIGDGAFMDCSSLTSIIIPGSVSYIGSGAFSRCTSLTEATIGDGVTTIWNGVFGNCTTLSYINLPGSITQIYGYAFSGCNNLSTVIYCGTQEQWDAIETDEGNECLAAAALQFHNYENGTCTVCQHDISVLTFELNSNRDGYVMAKCASSASGELVIPATYNGLPVTSIGGVAFDGCTNVTSITIPDSVTTIGWGAFNSCTGLTSIIIPDSVISIGSETFVGCISLTNLQVEEGNNIYHSAGNTIIETESKTLVVGCRMSQIPSDGSVTAIGNYAFYYCTGLVSINIPSSVTRIGSSAFTGCNSLSTVIYCGTSEQWNAIEKSSGNAPLTNATLHLHNYENSICVICGHKKLVAGDIDGNEGVTYNDAVYLLLHTLFGEEDYPLNGVSADMDGNGTVEQDDAVYLLLHTLFGEKFYPLRTSSTLSQK